MGNNFSCPCSSRKETKYERLSTDPNAINQDFDPVLKPGDGDQGENGNGNAKKKKKQKYQLPDDYFERGFHYMGDSLKINTTNLLEWYEFSLFSYAIVPIKAVLLGNATNAFMAFTLPFVFRPLGGIAMGAVADRYGRKRALLTSIVMTTVATVGQGLVPSYLNGHVAGNVGVVLLLTFRVMQGLAVGGQVGSSITYAVEYAPHDLMGAGSAGYNMASACGFFAGSLTFGILNLALSTAQMNAWGWRIPFVACAIPGIFLILAARSLPETSAFVEAHKSQESLVDIEEQEGGEAPTPQGESPSAVKLYLSGIKTVFRDHWRKIIVAFCVTGAASFLGYSVQAFLPSYLKDHLLWEQHMTIWPVTMGSLVSIVAAPVGAILVDTYGAGKVVCAGATVSSVLILNSWMLLQAFPTQHWIVYAGFSGMLGMSTGITGIGSFLFVPELYPTEVRATGVGLSWNVSALFGSFSPLVLNFLVDHSSPMAPGLLLFGTTAAGAAAMGTLLYLRDDDKWNVANIRTKLY